MATNAQDWKLGISVKDLSRENFDALAAAHVDVIEMSLAPADYPTLDWKGAAERSRESGVGIWSIHLPFYGAEKVDIACLDESVRRRTLDMQSEYMKRAAEIGIKIAVIHPALEPTEPNEREERIIRSSESLAELAELASKLEMTVAVEDLPRTCLGNTTDELKRIISIDNRLRVTFDVNHLLLDTHEEFIRKLGDKIVTLHISDYDFRNERHWLPYEGNINWVKLVEMLENANYSGPWMYELGLDAPKSINRSRELTYSDFRSNYESLIAKRKPEVLGVPVIEECLANAYIK
ncbi:MAG: sugar phosphate isomerase/epimerase [Clostridiales bacterium]|nr:sugar phosphate isomerase/epimerase [Clostridiales bacterium]